MTVTVFGRSTTSEINYLTLDRLKRKNDASRSLRKKEWCFSKAATLYAIMRVHLYLWKSILIPISGYENYLVFEDGRVLNTLKDRLIKPSLNENGYLYVSLWRNNKSKSKTLHRLVAEAFIPNPLDKPIVNHKDANRANPHKDNLEWMTQSENIAHGYWLGTMSQKRKLTPEQLDECLFRFLRGETMTSLSKEFDYALGPMSISLRNQAVKTNQEREFTQELIRQKNGRNASASAAQRQAVARISLDGKVLAQYESLTAAATSLGKDTSGPISNVLSGRQKTAYGYTWKFV